MAVICGTPTPATMRVCRSSPANANLHTVGAVVDERPRAVAGADVAAHYLHLR